MKISEFLHLALPEEQWLPMISGVLRQFGDEECYVYERQPCWYIGRGCQAQLQINADGTQATFIDDAGEQKWAVDSITDCARRFMTHPRVRGCRVYGQVGFNFAAHARGMAYDAGEWPLLTLTAPREELIFEKGNVTVYADSADGCRRLCEWVKEVDTATPCGPMVVDTAWTVKRINSRLRAPFRRSAAAITLKSSSHARFLCQRELICPLRCYMDDRPTRPPVRLCFASKDARRWVLVRNW
ncbi:Salicylate synthetase [Klebsiella michiganensis]|nr:Salicylate synthetase [Klebsiella michiganensis]